MTDRPGSRFNPLVGRLGFWSAILTALIAAAFLAIGVVSPVRSIPYPYVSGAAQYVPIDYIWMIPGFLLAPAVVVMMTSIHYYASDDRKIFSQLGVSFAIVYSAIVMIDYFIQWTVAVPSILNGQTEGLAPFSTYNPHGLLLSLEVLGYLMMTLALFAAAPVFSGGRRELAIRWLFAASFLLGAGVYVGFSLLGYGIVSDELYLITQNCTVLIASGVLLSLIFKRAGRST